MIIDVCVVDEIDLDNLWSSDFIWFLGVIEHVENAV